MSGRWTDANTAANMDRGFCPKNRSAAVVPSGRVSRKLCTAVKHARFLGWSSPRNSWFRNERYPLRPSTLALERWKTFANFAASCWSRSCRAGVKALNTPPGSHSGVRMRPARSRSGWPRMVR